jgi:hypothetical protein
MSDDIHGDNLANDIIKIVLDSGRNPLAKITQGFIEIQPEYLLENLTMYIVKRDHRVWQAGYDVGYGKGTGNLEPEEEG